MIGALFSRRFYLIGSFVFYLFSYLPFVVALQSNDVDYYIQKGPDFSLIFSENFLNNQKYIQLYNKLEHTNRIYKDIFYNQLKEVPTYVFASPRNQISNGVTSSIPFLKVIFYPSGVEMMTRLTVINWLDTLSVHEMVHIYQLGQMSKSLKILRAVFKNSEMVLTPLPVFLNVNLILPSFFLEGHASLNESLFSSGGRLYSGFTRAFIFSQLKHKYTTTENFIKQYIINLTPHPFSMIEKYSHGAYFFSTVMEKFKLKNINYFFKNHSKHFMLPLALYSVKSSFKETFKVSFESLLHRYIYRYLPLAVQQKKSKSKVLFRSAECAPFGWNRNEVFFLTSDLISTPILRVFNRVSHQWHSERKAFDLGKLFKIDNQYYVSSTHKVSPWKLMYGLFSEGMYFFDSKYQSQSVQDINQKNWLSIDTKDNLGEFRLFLNNKFYDTVHSPALFDEQGRVYYFKQSGLWRTMYRNQKALFQFKGFYGKPIGVSPEGEVLFIAASRFGSTVFAWKKNHGIYRVSDSDVVKEAILAKKNHLLICELEPDSYVYKMAPKKQLRGQPVLYSYSFNREELPPLTIDKLKKQPMPNQMLAKTASFSPTKTNIYKQKLHHRLTLPEGISRYSSFKNIQFNGLEMGWLYDSITGYNLLTGMSFKDFLEYNTFKILYQLSLDHYVISGVYSNDRFLVPWALKYSYRQGLENFFGERKYSYIHALESSVSVPLLRKGYWFSNFQLAGILSSLRLKINENSSYYFSLNPSWKISYGRIYSNNYDFHRRFYLRLATEYHAEMSLEDSDLLNHIYSYYTFHPGWNLYLTPAIRYRSAQKTKSIPFRIFRHLEFSQQPGIDIFLRRFELYQTNDYLSGSLKVQKVFNFPIYFSRYPLSLRRVAPFTQFKYIEYLDNKQDEKKFLLEWVVGADWDLLSFHKIPLRLGVSYGISRPVKFSWIWDGVPSPLFTLNLHSRI